MKKIDNHKLAETLMDLQVAVIGIEGARNRYIEALEDADALMRKVADIIPTKMEIFGNVTEVKEMGEDPMALYNIAEGLENTIIWNSEEIAALGGIVKHATEEAITNDIILAIREYYKAKKANKKEDK